MTEPSLYEQELQRQRARTDVPAGSLPVYRWYLRHNDPGSIEPGPPPADGLSIMRAVNPTVAFYRFLYHTAGENYLWGDRRRMSDEDLGARISPEHIHLMVLYLDGNPAGFYELSVPGDAPVNVNYFALLPGFTGRGLGTWMLKSAIAHVASLQDGPVTIDTCTLDHGSALINYRKRGFEIVRGEDEIYPDPRLDGFIPRDAAPQIPIAS